MLAGALCTSFAFIALGSSFAVLATLDGYPSASGQALRYALGAMLLAVVARWRLARPNRHELGRLLALAATGLAAFNLLVLAAERSMDPASVGVVVSAVPLVLAIAGPLQAGRPVSGRVLAAALAVAAGAAVVQGLGGEVTAAGFAAAVGALACEAAFSLLAAPLLPRLGPLGVSAWAAALAVPVLLAAGLALDRPVFAVPGADEALALAYLGVVVTAIAFVAFYAGVQRLGVERAGLFSGVLPVSALAAAALLGSAELTVERLLGVLLVALGLLAGVRSDQRRRNRRHRLGRPWSPPLGCPVPEGAHSPPGDGAGSRPLE